MIGNPFNVKFTSDRLNQPVTKESIAKVLKNDKIQCKDHINLEHIEFRNNEIYCKTCNSRLKLLPAWLIPE